MLPTITHTGGIKDYFHVGGSQVKYSLSVVWALLPFPTSHAWRTLCRTVCPLWSPSLTPFTALERLGRLSQPCQSLLYQFRFYFCSDTIPSLPQIWTISSFSGAAEVVCAIYCLWSSYFLSLKWMIRLPAASAISAFFHHIVLEASMYLIWLVDRFSILRTRG